MKYTEGKPPFQSILSPAGFQSKAPNYYLQSHYRYIWTFVSTGL